MIDPIRFLRESVVNYAGFSFKIYDGIGNPAEPFPQVVITSMSYNYANSKHCTAYSCTIDLSIYNDAAVRGGNLVTDKMADEILECFNDNAFIVPNFAVTDKRVANSSTSVVNLFNRVLYRRQFTIQIELSYG